MNNVSYQTYFNILPLIRYFSFINCLSEADWTLASSQNDDEKYSVLNVRTMVINTHQNKTNELSVFACLQQQEYVGKSSIQHSMIMETVKGLSSIIHAVHLHVNKNTFARRAKWTF